MSKKPKIKKRRHLSRMDLFPKKIAKENIELFSINEKIKESFPDKKERAEYINALLEGLEKEQCFEHERE